MRYDPLRVECSRGDDGAVVLWRLFPTAIDGHPPRYAHIPHEVPDIANIPNEVKVRLAVLMQVDVGTKLDGVGLRESTDKYWVYLNSRWCDTSGDDDGDKDLR